MVYIKHKLSFAGGESCLTVNLRSPAAVSKRSFLLCGRKDRVNAFLVILSILFVLKYVFL